MSTRLDKIDNLNPPARKIIDRLRLENWPVSKAFDPSDVSGTWVEQVHDLELYSFDRSVGETCGVLSILYFSIEYNLKAYALDTCIKMDDSDAFLNMVDAKNCVVIGGSDSFDANLIIEAIDYPIARLVVCCSGKMHTILESDLSTILEHFNQPEPTPKPHQE